MPRVKNIGPHPVDINGVRIRREETVTIDEARWAAWIMNPIAQRWVKGMLTIVPEPAPDAKPEKVSRPKAGDGKDPVSSKPSPAKAQSSGAQASGGDHDRSDDGAHGKAGDTQGQADTDDGEYQAFKTAAIEMLEADPEKRENEIWWLADGRPDVVEIRRRAGLKGLSAVRRNTLWKRLLKDLEDAGDTKADTG